MAALVFSFALVSACARVQIKDSQWCGDLGSQGAACFHTLTQGEEDIPKAIWDLKRFGQVCTPATTFADWKQAIEELCSYSNDCDYEVQQHMDEFFDRVQGFVQKRDLLMRQMEQTR